MKPLKKSIVYSLFLLSAATALSSCSSEPKKEAPVADEPKVETFSLQKQKLSTQLRMPAELISFQQVDIYAKVSSFVKDLKVDIGTQVTKGQLLMVLEAPEISSQLSAAESRLKAMQAIYEASKSNYTRIYETSKTPGTISKNDLDQATARKNSDYAQYQAAVATSKEVGIMRGYLEIRAPFSGVISARNINLGAYVGPAGKGSDLPLLTIQEQGKLRLSVAVPEIYTSYLNKGDEMNFTVKSLPDTFSAKIQRLAGALDLRLRSERVEMDVDNKGKRLLPGMVAEVILPLNPKDSSFVIPKTALVNSAEGIFVIGVVDGKAKHINVTTGRELDGQIEIFGNLTQGISLIKKANEEIHNGDVIKL
ncbi:efflux RND transporter periplasmic adaptor subunit [Pedobacter sp. MC2016-14]|uniref:efflux RND transporter periplasmic adaptor subunit n=1 Tax=Pedobacter sp. MC2016-14 TaxID=2897327 RepID=UPI001E61A8C8|nr:efflux RND transporter periplasmic adaptor subunit [Pedobacter sp. MC2016-14]MCD0489256.1 efflux RND transporter periplasmic adaptor subunit [Pedobacter sp. MC2016-14]